MAILSNLITAIQAVLGFSVLILVHELGHFLAAKKIGVRVEAFSLGFGPFLGKKWGETEYRLSLIPIGGYVKMAGEEREPGKEPQPHEFTGKRVSQRALVFVAGPIMNLLLAFVAFIVAFQLGVRVTPAVAGYVIPGSPAWHAGIQRGDRVVSLNGRPDYVDFEDLAMTAALGNPADSIRLGVLRKDQRLSFDLKPEYMPDRGVQGIGLEHPLVLRIMKFLPTDGHEPAREAGLLTGDLVLAAAADRPGLTADGLSPVADAYEMSRIVRGCQGRPLLIQYQRTVGDQMTVDTVKVTPRRAASKIGWTLGVEHELGSNMVGDVRRGSWLAASALKQGDRIVAVGDAKGLQRRSQIEEAVRAAAGKTASIAWTRDGESKEHLAEVSVPEVPDIDAVLALQPLNVVDRVVPGSPAEELGIQPGDRILKVADQAVGSPTDLLLALYASKGEKLSIQWARGEETKVGTFVPVTPWFIGVQWSVIEERIPLGPWGACARGTRKTMLWIRRFYSTVVGFATRRVAHYHLRGVLTIGQVTYAAAKHGVAKLIYFVGLISINLGLLNLAPIPVLDGGQLLFALIEGARGKPLNERLQGAATYAGLAVILALVLFATWTDVWGLFGQ